MHDMRRLIKAVGAVKLTLALLILGTVVTAGAVHSTLPSQATNGQDHAAAGAANGQDHAAAGAANGQSANTAQDLDTEAVTDRLAANEDRLLTNLDKVLARLQDAGANQHAADALQAVIDRLTNESIGLNRASDAVSSQGTAHGELPEAATNHPTSDDHPRRP
jgi:hypothetical protein